MSGSNAAPTGAPNPTVQAMETLEDLAVGATRDPVVKAAMVAVAGPQLGYILAARNSAIGVCSATVIAGGLKAAGYPVDPLICGWIAGTLIVVVMGVLHLVVSRLAQKTAGVATIAGCILLGLLLPSCTAPPSNGAALAPPSAAQLATAISDATIIVSGIQAAYVDLQLDDPNAVPKGSEKDQLILSALSAAIADARALGSAQTPGDQATRLAVVETDINGVANLVNTVLPIAAATDPKLGAVVIGFQAAALLNQTIIEPLVNQLAAQSGVSAPTPTTIAAARFRPSPGMTVPQAEQALMALAGVPK